jgi:hypothetical protein
MELVITPQPKKLFHNFSQTVQNHQGWTVASVTTAEGLQRRYARCHIGDITDMTSHIDDIARYCRYDIATFDRVNIVNHRRRDLRRKKK